MAETQRIRLEKELQMARAVQRSLREVAGDFYDFLPLPDGWWGLLLADVSGKGAPAALYMALARSLIRSEAKHHASPSAVLTAANRRLLVEAPCEMFVTAFYAVLDPVSRSLTYGNAGHDPPFLRSASGVQRLALGGLIMGLFEGLTLKDETLTLERGDALIAYTDGLTDTVNDRDQRYGDSRLAGTINNAPVAAEDILTCISRDLEAFAGQVPQPDDVTLLILTAD